MSVSLGSVVMATPVTSTWLSGLGLLPSQDLPF